MIIIKNNEIIRRSKNLRCLTDYTRLSPVRRVECKRLENKVTGAMRVIYNDGAECTALFLRYTHLLEWILQRRSWQGADIVIHDDDIIDEYNGKVVNEISRKGLSLCYIYTNTTGKP